MSEWVISEKRLSLSRADFEDSIKNNKEETKERYRREWYRYNETPSEERRPSKYPLFEEKYYPSKEKRIKETIEESPYTKSQSRYVYVVRDAKGNIYTISSTKLIKMPRGSEERKILYDSIIQKYIDYELDYSDLNLLMTYDALLGERILGGP